MKMGTTRTSRFDSPLLNNKSANLLDNVSNMAAGAAITIVLKVIVNSPKLAPVRDDILQVIHAELGIDLRSEQTKAKRVRDVSDQFLKLVHDNPVVLIQTKVDLEYNNLRTLLRKKFNADVYRWVDTAADPVGASGLPITTGFVYISRDWRECKPDEYGYIPEPFHEEDADPESIKGRFWRPGTSVHPDIARKALLHLTDYEDRLG